MKILRKKNLPRPTEAELGFTSALKHGANSVRKIFKILIKTVKRRLLFDRFKMLQILTKRVLSAR